MNLVLHHLHPGWRSTRASYEQRPAIDFHLRWTCDEGSDIVLRGQRVAWSCGRERRRLLIAQIITLSLPIAGLVPAWAEHQMGGNAQGRSGRENTAFLGRVAEGTRTPDFRNHNPTL